MERAGSGPSIFFNKFLLSSEWRSGADKYIFINSIRFSELVAMEIAPDFVIAR